MNGKRARRLRKQVYGSEYAPKERTYHWEADAGDKRPNPPLTHVVADDRRRSYQQLKRA